LADHLILFNKTVEDATTVIKSYVIKILYYISDLKSIAY